MLPRINCRDSVVVLPAATVLPAEIAEAVAATAFWIAVLKMSCRPAIWMGVRCPSGLVCFVWLLRDLLLLLLDFLDRFFDLCDRNRERSLERRFLVRERSREREFFRVDIAQC